MHSLKLGPHKHVYLNTASELLTDLDRNKSPFQIRQIAASTQLAQLRVNTMNSTVSNSLSAAAYNISKQIPRQ